MAKAKKNQPLDQSGAAFASPAPLPMAFPGEVFSSPSASPMIFPERVESKTSGLPSPLAPGYDEGSKKQGTEAMTTGDDTPPPKRSKDRHRPGYISPNRKGTRLVGAYVPVEIADALSAIAKIQKTTVQDILAAFITEKVKTTLPAQKREELAREEITRIRARYGVNDKAAPT